VRFWMVWIVVQGLLFSVYLPPAWYSFSSLCFHFFFFPIDIPRPTRQFFFFFFFFFVK
jgi:hypothetical protein